MKKIALLLCLVIAFAIPLSGCKKDDEVKVDKTEITIWTSSRHEMDIRSQQVEKFNAEHDDIEIKLEIKGDDVRDLITVALQGGTAPDIFPAMGETVYKAGHAREFPADYVDELKGRFLPGALVAAQDGKYYSVGLQTTTYKMVYNKDLFRESGLDPENPPKTWEQLEEYARVITEKGAGKKYGFALPFKASVFTRYYVGIPGATDGNYNEDGYDVIKGEFNFDCMKPLLEIYQRMNNDKVLFPTPLSLDNDTARAQFSKGNIGMLMSVSWDVGVFNDQFPAECDWAVAEIPTLTGEVKGGYPYGIGGSGYNMNSKTKDAEKQLEVYKWWISEEIIQELSKEGKGPYSLVSTQKPEFTPDDKKGAQEFAKVSDPKRIALGAQSYIPPVTVDGDVWTDTFVSIVTSDKDVDTAIDDLNKRYNMALDEYIQKQKEESPDFDEKKYIIPDYDYSIGINK